MKAGVGHTFEGKAVAGRRYLETGRTLDNGGCVGDKHVVVEPCLIFLCILQWCLAMGSPQVAFIEARLGHIPQDSAVDVKRMCYRGHTGVRLDALPSLEEAEAPHSPHSQPPLSLV